MTAIIPQPRCSVKVRPAGSADLPFIDQLQKLHTHMVGFFPRKQMEGYLEKGAILVAEEVRDQRSEISQSAEGTPAIANSSGLTSDLRPLTSGSPLGYIVSRDEYSGRDDVGIIYQINVTPSKHRHLIGAMLVKAAFDKAAYGCKLFCCWCAQDIAANWFWESLGFVPLAFRTGSRSKQRTHIFWQKRIREGDVTTPWWFPSQTKSGSYREDRLAFPIPPNVHWRDPMPVIVPELAEPRPAPNLTLPGGTPVRPRPAHTYLSQQEREKAKKALMVPIVTRSGVKHIARPGMKDPEQELARAKREPKAPAPKHDPKHIQLARELRDRFLEQVNRDPSLLLPAGKYEVAKALPLNEPRASASGSGPLPHGRGSLPEIEVKALPAAA